MKLYFFKDINRIGNGILENPIIHFLPNHPNGGKPNNPEK